MSNIFAQLAAPFAPDKVSWRLGSTTKDKSRGMALAYVDARDVMERLDDVLGPARWQNRYTHTTGKTVCEIGICVRESYVTADKDGQIGSAAPAEWVWKADGAGDTDVESEKGALSDAFKRAAVRWGIGRYLYDIASPWVELEPKGSSHIIKPSEYARLRGLLGASGIRSPAAETPLAPSDDSAELRIEMLREIAAIGVLPLLQRWNATRKEAKSFDLLSDGDYNLVTAAFKARKVELTPAITAAG